MRRVVAPTSATVLLNGILLAALVPLLLKLAERPDLSRAGSRILVAASAFVRGRVVERPPAPLAHESSRVA
jgi:hypothetical protein